MLVGQLLAQIPDQVTDAIEAVESHRQRGRELNQELRRDGQRTKRSRNGRGAQLPAEQRRRKIPHGKEVQRTGTDEARDSVEHTRVPSDLGTVDGQMRRNGPSQALLSEELAGIGRRASRRGRRSVIFAPLRVSLAGLYTLSEL